MSKHLERAITTLRKLHKQDGISEQESDTLIGQFIENQSKAQSVQHEKAFQEASEKKRIENLPHISTLIGVTDLETLKTMVNRRDKARDTLKNASVGSHVDAFKTEHLASLAVLEFSHVWAQCTPKDLVLFEIDDRVYLIKERVNGIKYIGYKTKKEGQND